MKIKVRRTETEIQAVAIFGDNEKKPENFKNINEDALGTAHLYMIQHPEIKEITFSSRLSKPDKTEREATETK